MEIVDQHACRDRYTVTLELGAWDLFLLEQAAYAYRTHRKDFWIEVGQQVKDGEYDAHLFRSVCEAHELLGQMQMLANGARSWIDWAEALDEAEDTVDEEASA